LEVVDNYCVTCFFSYGVSRVYSRFALGVWKVNKTVYQSTIDIDSGDIPNLMFHTPLDRSYLCADVGHLELKTTLRYNILLCGNVTISLIEIKQSTLNLTPDILSWLLGILIHRRKVPSWATRQSLGKRFSSMPSERTAQPLRVSE